MNHRNRSFGYRTRFLCAGASVTALLASGGLSDARAATAAQLLSPGNLMLTAGERASATSQGAAASLLNPAVQAQIALSTTNLANAAQALKNILAAQSAASSSSQLTLNNAPLSGSSWNGTPLSGLNPEDTSASTWINASPLQKNTATATATVVQTAANAVLTWQSFDLNKGETLVFDQQGNATWNVLNRIVAGPANSSGSRFIASPSYILGSIQAPGAVYVINPNGIIFGPTAQINVHSLIASSLDVGNPNFTLAERNSFFLNQGIDAATGVNTSFSYNQDDAAVEGNIKVEAGATITTTLAPRTVSPDAGGFVYLFGPNVENDGTISTPVGETLMVAAEQLQLTPNIYAAGGQVNPTSATAPLSTFRAVGVNFNLDSSDSSAVTPWRTVGPNSNPNAGLIRTPGQVINTGLIDAERGVVILNGDEVTNGALKSTSGATTQVGVIEAATSITRNSQIFLDARLRLTLATGSTVQILPDENGETIPLSAVQSASASNPSFVPGLVEMQGNTVDMQSGSLVLAPGGTVSVTGTPSTSVAFVLYPTVAQAIVNNQLLNQARIYVDTGSSIDVSGLDDVLLPMSDNLISFKPFGNEFADQPLQRDGSLVGLELTVDVRQTGTYNGQSWVGTPLADVTAYASNIPVSINQLLTTGGKVSINSTQADQVILRQGSTINVAGGYVRYQGGVVATTNLLTSDGRVVNIADADPLLTYVGIAGVNTETHPHWGTTTSQTFVNPLLTQGEYQPSYIEGHDAGGISLNSSNVGSVYSLGGAFYAAAIIGERQAALGIPAAASTANTLAANPNAIPSSGYLNIVGGNNLTLEKTVAPLNPLFGLNSNLPTSVIDTTSLSTDVLTEAGFGKINASFVGALDVTNNASLSVANGGSIAITSGSAAIDGDLTARSGSIAIQTNSNETGGETVASPTPPDLFNLDVGPRAVLDVSGLWVNDSGATPETLVGSAFVNGGSISLTTVTKALSCATPACTSLVGAGNVAFVDVTGNIVLARGSQLNASSGGRIGTNGQFQLDSSGRAIGTGGNVTLETYAGGFSIETSGQVSTTTSPAATIILGGSDGSAAENARALKSIIHDYGFAQGGTLAIQVPTIQVGGTASTTAGTLNLAPSFFDGNGFSKYNLTSVVGGITVAANTTVTLRQQNFIAASDLLSLPTGANVTAATGVGYLPEFIRAPVDLSLDANLSPLPSFPYMPPADLATLPPSVALLIGQGAVIAADPEANISLQVVGRVEENPSNSAVGNVDGQSAVAEILGTIRTPGGTIALSGSSNAEIWLGAKSRLDVSGVLVQDTRQPAYTAGTVLPGGTVSITTDPSGALIGLKGAQIDASGASGTLDIAQGGVDGGVPGIVYAPTSVWSDAGSISLTAATMLFDGSFVAKPGAAKANGGSLAIAAPTTSATISVRQAGNAIPAGLTPTTALDSVTGTILFDADQLTRSGIADLTLSAEPLGGSIEPGTVQFANGVKIGGLDRLEIDASVIALANIPRSSKSTACSVCLSADYFLWQGSGSTNPDAGTGILTVQAGAIDISAGGQGTGLVALSGAAQANFISTGDIRLLTPLANVPVDLPPDTLLSGQLITAGDLTLQAAQVYPATAVDFTLKSSATDGVITIQGNGQSAAAPLSAGGEVTVDATIINQDGRLVAPLGVVRLGVTSIAGLSVNDDSGIFVGTRKVTLGSGSVTSVSLAGLVVPYGETSDGKNWSYENQLGLPLTAAPPKEITISGARLDLESGSTVNLSGGGDLQAIEYVNGTGGTHNVLTDAPSVYAIIPGYNPAVAPIDYDFDKIQGNSQPQAGSGVYLTASSGLPAGFYTLLPADYATLPGAYRIQVLQGTQDAVASQNRVLPDGTVQVAGYLANQAAGTQSARTVEFDVQSSTVWRQYSEIDQTSANTYFASLAQSSGDGTARLPIDAGHLVIDALRTVTLQAQLAADAATGGRGSEVDIAGTDIQVVSTGDRALTGYIQISAGELTALGADSLLIGGERSDNGSDEETITTTANSVEITTGASAPLAAPEIIVVAGTSKTTTDPNAKRGLVVGANSVIESKGTLAANDPTSFAIVDGRSQVVGDSAFLAVSSGGPLTVTRATEDGAHGNAITIDNGAKISGSSLTIDAHGQIRLSSGATYAIKDIAITSTAINLGEFSGANPGATLSPGVLAAMSKVNSLTLRSLGSITFSGDVGISLAGSSSSLTLDSGFLVASDSSIITLKAATVDLVNSGVASTKNAAAGNSSFNVEASNLIIDAGSKQLSGFSTVTLTGTQQVDLVGTGSFDLGSAALNIGAPRILVSTGAAQSITTTGAATLANGAGAESVASGFEIGGTLNVNASSIVDSTLIQATAGGVTLEASSGDVTLGATAEILAPGYAEQFYDTVEVSSGGSISLISDKGSVDVASGAMLNVSSAAGYAGNAGSIALSAANGSLSSNKGAFDFSTVSGSLAGDSGGSLAIDAESLGTAVVSIPSIFSNTVDIHVSTGNLQLGGALTAANVTLTADAGTLTIGQTINASGTSGGSISLFGGRGVILTASGSLLATASDASEHGGDIVIGTEVASQNGSGSAGIIELQGGLIDVSNTADAAMGGTVRLRAPLIGTAMNDVAIDPVATTIKGASSVTVEAFEVFDPGNSAFNGVIDPAKQPGFYGSCTATGVCTGTLVEFVQNFALSSQALQKFSGIAAGTLQVQPGIELVNDDRSVNHGDITVASAWNLGAGIAGDLVNLTAFTAGNVTVPAGTVVTDQNGQLLAQYAGYTGQLGYVSGVSQITTLFYRVGGSPTGEAGTLTLRAAGDVDINASISDGFFQTSNRLDQTYLKNLNNWVATATAVGSTTDVSDVGGYIVGGATLQNSIDGAGPVPVAPYDPGANTISPVQTTDDPAPIAGADLFPLISDPKGTIAGPTGNYDAVASWSYRFVGGANTNSANPLAVAPLARFASGTLAGQGNVTINGGGAVYVRNLNSDGPQVALEIPTIVRTGTGSIDIAAGRDFILANTEAPGVVYTAGRTSVALPDPDYKMQTVADPLNPGQTITIPVAANPSGFLSPDLLTCDPGSSYNCNAYGPITAAAYPVAGGHLTITVQQDILGYENPEVLGRASRPNQQYFAPWLIAQGTSLSDTEFGVFSTLSGDISSGGNIFSPSQTSWWINFGSFDQGIMSVGGNVTIVAGRDISQLSVSLPTTARVSGGLSNTITNAAGQTVANIPVVNLNASGNLTVIAGRNIESGSYYEGSGQATIVSGGSVAANWSAHATPGDNTSTFVPVSTLLAVDTGQIALSARGSVNIAGVVSAVSLQNVADPTGNTSPTLTSSYLSSYGPNSAVTLTSISGNVVTNSLGVGQNSADILIANAVLLPSILGQGSIDISGYRGVSAYPANFQAIALGGNVTVASALQLAPSNTGTLNLLAYGSLITQSAVNYDGTSTDVADGFQALSTGPSLVEQSFNASEALAGFAPPVGSQVLDLGALLLHQGDTVPDRFYALTGDIVSGEGSTTVPAKTTAEYALSWEVNKVAQVHAGQDIVDLPFFGQNLAPTDVTQIIAGRDIYYTGALSLVDLGYPSRPDLPQPENAAGLSLAGPGFFDIEAGRNLGPFVTAGADAAAGQNQFAPTDPTGTGIITFGNNVVVGNRLMIDGHDVNQNKIDDPFATGTNFLLPQQGADIVTLVGTGKQAPDYQAFLNTYVNPNTDQFANHPASVSTTDYSTQLADFLQTTLGEQKAVSEIGQIYAKLHVLPLNPTPAQIQTYDNSLKIATWDVFQTLSIKLQDVFADQVYFNELALAGSEGEPLRGYQAATILFSDTQNQQLAQLFANGTPVTQQQFLADVTYTFNGYTFTEKNNNLIIDKIVVNSNGDLTSVPIPDSLNDATADAGNTVVLQNTQDNPTQWTLKSSTGSASQNSLSINSAMSGTAKNITLGSGSVNKVFVAQAQTGDLEMLHATIKTLQSNTVPYTTDVITPGTGGVAVNGDAGNASAIVGGDIAILAPGGNITVGSQAVEINSHLTDSALGILTLDDGVIDTFTDGSVLVNESRVLTVQGGNVTLWSSNGDLDAGKGAKTSVDFRPLSVNFSPSDLQTINLNGLVSGAGIGTIRSTPDAPAASAILIARRGTVNAGAAGLRTTGNLAIVALRVLNAANISSLGAVTGVPTVASVNITGALSASSTAAASNQAAEQAVAAAANKNTQLGVRQVPSVITVEVLGFGDCDPESGKACQQ